MAQRRVRWPILSPATPNIGAISVPANCKAPNRVSSSTEPVSTSTYQPRISVSISKAQEVSRSAGHCRRKARTRKGAKADGPSRGLKRWDSGASTYRLLPVASRRTLPWRPSGCGPRRLHEVGAQCLAPIGDGGDLLLLQEHLGVLGHIAAEIRGEAGIDVDGGQRLAKRVLRHGVALGSVEAVDGVGHLAGVVLEVAGHVDPGFEIVTTVSALLATNSGVAAMNTGIWLTLQ